MADQVVERAGLEISSEPRVLDVALEISSELRVLDGVLDRLTAVARNNWYEGILGVIRGLAYELSQQRLIAQTREN